MLVLGSLLGLAALVLSGLVLFAVHTTRRVERAVPPLGTLIALDGARIHYVDRGSGPAVVLIHGLGGQLRNFTHSLAEQLAADFRVIALDRPGAGYSLRSPGTSARLGVQADAVAQLIGALALDRPLLVGHSLGGAVALAVAVVHPEIVSGLALVAPLTQVEAEPPRAFARLLFPSRVVRRLVAWTVATPLAIRHGRTTLASIFAPERLVRDFGTAGGGLLSLRPVTFYETASDLVAVNEDLPALVARYSSLRIPVGILFGRSDSILDPRIHGERMLSNGDNVTLELIEGGHMLPVTAPERVADFVRSVAARLP